MLSKILGGGGGETRFINGDVQMVNLHLLGVINTLSLLIRYDTTLTVPCTTLSDRWLKVG